MFNNLREDAQENERVVFYIVAEESGTCDVDGVMIDDYYDAIQASMSLPDYVQCFTFLLV